MARFSATDAALAGFRIVSERPRVLAIWAPVQFVLSLAITLFAAATAGPQLAQMMALAAQPTVNADRVAELSREFAPTGIVLIAYALITGAVINAAMNRAVLRTNEDRFGYLRLSSDELLQLALLALFAAVFYLALVLLVAFLAAILSLGPAGAFVGLLALTAAACGLVFVAVRLSLASAMTFAAHRIRIAESWGMTQGRFWPLLGAYAIAFVLRFVVLGLTLAIAAAAAGIASKAGGGLGGPHQSQLLTVSDILTPAGLIDLVVTAFGQALAWPILVTPPAVIYRSLGQSPG